MPLLLLFDIADSAFAVPVEQVIEINQLLDVTRVPNVPDFVEGVVNLRGKVVPLVNLAAKLRVKSLTASKNTSIIIVPAESGHIGVMVDRVHSVISLPESQIEPPPVFSGESDHLGCTGIGTYNDRVIIVLNLLLLLSGANFHKASALPDISSHPPIG